MTQQLKEKQAEKLKEVIEAKVLAEKEYRLAARRESEILEQILLAYDLNDVTNIQLDGTVLSYEENKEKKK